MINNRASGNCVCVCSCAHVRACICKFVHRHTHKSIHIHAKEAKFESQRDSCLLCSLYKQHHAQGLRYGNNPNVV